MCSYYNLRFEIEHSIQVENMPLYPGKNIRAALIHDRNLKNKNRKKANFTYKGMPLYVRPYGKHYYIRERDQSWFIVTVKKMEEHRIDSKIMGFHD